MPLTPTSTPLEKERKLKQRDATLIPSFTMAPEWEIGVGMDFGMGMGVGMDFGMGATFSTASAAAAVAAPLTGSASPAYLYGLPSTDTLHVDDLLDFSHHDVVPSAEVHLLPTPEQSSAITAATRPFSGDTESSSIFQTRHDTSSSFPDDIYIPSEEAAELEWLSKFVEDSFSNVPYPTAVTGIVAPAGDAHLRMEPPVPGRGARSKRSRAPTGFGSGAAWSSLPPPSQTSPSSSSSSSSSDFPTSKPKASAGSNKNNNNGSGRKGGGEIGVEGGVRRCTHCASEKTPQWRTGPLGPKTLCNACGVRYKSGRLVPEYRPAASPTFVLTQHSNSHRKVMELRRQKELLLLHHDNSSSGAATSPTAAPGQRSELLFHDYGVC